MLVTIFTSIGLTAYALGFILSFAGALYLLSVTGMARECRWCTFIIAAFIAMLWPVLWCGLFIVAALLLAAVMVRRFTVEPKRV